QRAWAGSRGSAGKDRLEIIGGTIGSPVAYPMLQRSECPVRIGIPHSFDSRVEMNLVLRQARDREKWRADSPIGTPRLTYCQAQRQIPPVVCESGAGCDADVPVVKRKAESGLTRPGYRYRASASRLAFHIASTQHLA